MPSTRSASARFQRTFRNAPWLPCSRLQFSRAGGKLQIYRRLYIIKWSRREKPHIQTFIKQKSTIYIKVEGHGPVGEPASSSCPTFLFIYLFFILLFRTLLPSLFSFPLGICTSIGRQVSPCSETQIVISLLVVISTLSLTIDGLIGLQRILKSRSAGWWRDRLDTRSTLTDYGYNSKYQPKPIKLQWPVGGFPNFTASNSTAQWNARPHRWPFYFDQKKFTNANKGFDSLRIKKATSFSPPTNIEIIHLMGFCYSK